MAVKTFTLLPTNKPKHYIEIVNGAQPARMSHSSSSSSPGGMPRLPRANQRSSSTRRLTSVTYRRWTGPTYNTVLASSRRYIDVRSYHWRQSDVKWTSRLAVDVSRRLIDVNLTYLCYLGKSGDWNNKHWFQIEIRRFRSLSSQAVTRPYSMHGTAMLFMFDGQLVQSSVYTGHNSDEVT